MFSTSRKTAWAAALAVGGLLLVGTAAARADDARRGDHRRGDRNVRARSSDAAAMSEIVSPLALTNPDTVGRTSAGGRHGSRGREVAHASHERLPRPTRSRPLGSWRRARRPRVNASSREHASKHGRGGHHWGERTSQSSRSAVAHASSGRPTSSSRAETPFACAHGREGASSTPTGPSRR